MEVLLLAEPEARVEPEAVEALYEGLAARGEAPRFDLDSFHNYLLRQAAAIRDKTERLTVLAAACIADAGLTRDRIATIFFTGGSSRVPAVRDAIAAAAPSARVAAGSDFLSVALGLTQEAARRYK